MPTVNREVPDPRPRPARRKWEGSEDGSEKSRIIPCSLAAQIIVQMIEETVEAACFLRKVPGPVGTFDVHPVPHFGS